MIINARTANMVAEIVNAPATENEELLLVNRRILIASLHGFRQTSIQMEQKRLRKDTINSLVDDGYEVRVMDYMKPDFWGNERKVGSLYVISWEGK